MKLFKISLLNGPQRLLVEGSKFEAYTATGSTHFFRGEELVAVVITHHVISVEISEIPDSPQENISPSTAYMQSQIPGGKWNCPPMKDGVGELRVILGDQEFAQEDTGLRDFVLAAKAFFAANPPPACIEGAK